MRRAPPPCLLCPGRLPPLIPWRPGSPRRPRPVAAAHGRQAEATAPLLLQSQLVEAVDLRQGAAHRLVLEGGDELGELRVAVLLDEVANDEAGLGVEEADGAGGVARGRV